MATWQLQEAKARFSEVIETAIRKGPQIITRRGVEAAVIVPMEEWKRLSAERAKGPDARTERERSEAFLRLLQSGPDFEIPDRHRERLEWRRAAR